MADILKIRRSITSGNVPALASLSEGELAVNIPDKKLWIGNTVGDPIELIDKTLNDILDVSVLNHTQGDRLAWDDSKQLWVPMASISGLGIVTFDYKYEANDIIPPPKEGYIMCDNTNPLQATKLYIHRIDRKGEETDSYWSEIKAGDWFNIYDSKDVEVYESYDVIDSSIDKGAYWEVPVAYFDAQGVVGDSDKVKVAWRISAAYPHEILVERDAPDSHPISAITDLDNTISSKMHWKNKWLPGIYEANDVVRDNDWVMVANKTTSDYPSPQPIGDLHFVLPEEPEWNTFSYNGQIYVGIRFNNLVEEKAYYIENIRVWISDLRNTTRYRLIGIDNITGHKQIGKLFYGNEISSKGWLNYKLDNPFWINNESDVTIAIIIQNIEESTQETLDYVYIDRDREPEDDDPGSGNINYNRDDIFVRLSTTDNNGADQTIFLDNLINGSTIRITSTSDAQNWIEFNVLDLEGIYTNHYVFNCIISGQGADRPDKETLASVLFNIPIPASVEYVMLPDYLLDIPSLSGVIELGNAGEISNNNGYNIDVEYQEYEESIDWDYLAHSSGSTTGSSSTDNSKFKEPMDSGIYEGGMISKGIGDLDVNIDAGKGIVVDAITDPCEIRKTDVEWVFQTITITPLSIDTQEIHEIYIDSSGTIISTPTQNIIETLGYDYIHLGYVELGVNIIYNVVPTPHIIGQTARNLADLFFILDDESKTKGLRVKPAKSLGIYVEKGEIISPGINWYNDRKDQNTSHIAQQGDEDNPITLSIFNKSAQNIMLPQSNIPKYYDLDGISILPLSGAEATIHYIYYSTSGYSLQLGQTAYKDFAEAFRHIDQDKNEFQYAPGANVSVRSMLIGQIIISKLVKDNYDKSLFDIVSIINGETGNTIAPVDLTLVPQYLLRTYATEDLMGGDELSMDVNGNVQKYPATGGEGETHFTTDVVIKQRFVFLNYSNNTGIVSWINDTNDNTINIVTAQGNSDGSISYSPVATFSAGSSIIDYSLDKISTTTAGFIYTTSSATSLGTIDITDITSTPFIGTTRLLSGPSNSVDCKYDLDNDNLIGVYSLTSNDRIYNRHCRYISGVLELPESNERSMVYGTKVKCTTENSNIIVIGINGTTSEWRESGWNGNDRYNDRGDIIYVNDCVNIEGLEVYSGEIKAQFKNVAENIILYTASYKSNDKIDPPVLKSTFNGKYGGLVKSLSGILYTIIVSDIDVIKIYEHNTTGTDDIVYLSSISVDPNNTEMQCLMFGTVFAIHVGYVPVDANKIYLFDSSLTRTDHFIGVAPHTTLQGQHIEVDIALPIIKLPRTYPSGTMYYYGPYKYQVITPTQAVLIIESTIMEATVV